MADLKASRAEGYQEGIEHLKDIHVGAQAEWNRHRRHRGRPAS